MSNQRVKGLGRLRYVEPSNFFQNKEGNLSDSIGFPYEDYCMAVDLTIRQTNRYSCGWWNQSGDVNEITYSSKKGTLSFIGGTEYGDGDGYLTTNFTDISMVNPESNTAECLGISSINIDYDSWWYPQVTIKFVDVRGATVMQPAEKGYYNDRELGTASSIYKGLFSFPYPMFVLKVKGFYGKGVTYHLALHNTVYEFDANTGDFNITASFIGYKFGIYTDLPMTFLGCAPYMEGGKEYWEQKKESGEFCFRDRDGNKGRAMYTIPELREALAMAAQNQDAISAAAEEQEALNIDSKQIETLISLKDTFPFNDWKNTKGADFKGTHYCFKIFNNIYEIDEFYERVTDYIKVIKAYDEVYDKKLMNTMSILDTASGTTEEYIKKNPRLMGYWPFSSSLSKYSFSYVSPSLNLKEIYGKEEYKRIEKIIKSQPDVHNIENKIIINSPDKNSILKWIDNEVNTSTNFFIIAYENAGSFNPHNFMDYVEKELKAINERSTEQKRKYKERSVKAIEKALGFTPSIKNIYDLVFAHMDTFIHTFYASTKRIKDQLEGDKPKRAKDTYNIRDGYTDTENVKVKLSNGSSVENTNARSKYLPPYAAYYTDNTSGVAKGKSLAWLEEIPNGENLEEVSFVNNLINGAETYFKKAKDVEKLLKDLNDSGGTGVDMAFADPTTPMPTVSDFVPVTVFDFAYKGKYDNPYLVVNKRLTEGAEIIESEILTILALRAAQYYTSCLGENNDKNVAQNSETFGKIEAINLFKAVGDNFSNGFLDFLKKYATLTDKKEKSKIEDAFINALTNSNGVISKNLQTDGPNLNKTLFKTSGDYLLYNYHKGNKMTQESIEKYGGSSKKEYRIYPFRVDGIKQLQNVYTTGADMFNNQQMLPTSADDLLYSKEGSDVSSFVIYDSRDYLTNIYKLFSDEAEKAVNYVNNSNGMPVYGNRGPGDFNDIENKEETLTEYKNNISADEFTENQYYASVLVHSEGFAKASEINDIINKNSKDEQNRYSIKYATFDYTFDEENPSSIFNNSIYYEQGDNIKAKAFLFLLASPIVGNEYGILNDSRSGRSLKSILLREGAYYWYADTNAENGVKWTNKVEYMRNGANGKLEKSGIVKNVKTPRIGEYIPLINNPKKWNKQFDGIDFDNFTYFSLNNNGGYQKIKAPTGTTPSRIKTLKKFFEDWAEGSFKENEEALRNINLYSRGFNDIGEKIFKRCAKKTVPYWYYFNLTETMINNSSEIKYDGNKVANLETVSDVLNDVREYKLGFDTSFLLSTESQTSIELRQLQTFLRDLYLGVCTVFELYSTKKESNAKTEIIIHNEQMRNVMYGFLTQLYLTYYTPMTDYKDNKQSFYKNVATAIKMNPFENADLKLSTYMTLKSLYDKWLSFPPYGPEETWCLTRKGSTNSEFDNFIYVDTYYNEIGDKLLVNITKVTEWLSSIVPNGDISSTEGQMQYTGRTVYEFLTEVAQSCGGNLFAIPQKFAMASEESIKNMFTPMPLYSNWDDDSSGYVFMYTYQPSQHLGDTGTTTIDMNGWSPEGDGLDLSDDEIVGSVLPNSDDAYIIPAFGVTYAKQNQSMFKNIQLTTATMTVTEASIGATFDVAAKTSESPRETTLYGQDLYRIYSNYSYNCSVETMGNMQIMPMMYFQLNNVPFWRGAYQIIKVGHSITAGNISTTFEGVRINRHAIPMADGTLIIEPVTGDEVIDGKTPTDGTMITGAPNPGSYKGELSASNFKWLDTSNHPNIVNTVVDTYGKTTSAKSYQKHGMDDLADNPGNNSSKSSYFKNYDAAELGFNPANVSETNPIICLLPAHWKGDSNKGWNEKYSTEGGSPKGKTGEYTWSSQIITKIHEKLKSEGYLSYLARTPYPNNNEKNGTAGPAYALVDRFGSRKVISVMPHWNGMGGTYWRGLMNASGQTTRLDSVKLMECICEEANAIKETLSGKAKEMTAGNCAVTHYYTIPGKSPYAADAGCMPNCAAACTENWFGDWNGWEGRQLLGGELFDKVVDIHVNGIKRYIRMLQDGPIRGAVNGNT